MLSLRWKSLLGLLPAAAALLTFSLNIGLAPSMAEDTKEAAKADDDTNFEVPDGTPEEIFKFIDSLKERQPKFASQKERIDFAIKVQRAFITAGDKVLKQDVTEKVAVQAVQMKMSALTLLAMNSIGDSAKEAMEAAVKLRADERVAVVKAIDPYWSAIRIANVGDAPEADRKKLADEFIAAVTETKFSPQAMRDATQLGDVLANKGFSEEAGAMYDSLVKLSKESDNPRFQENASRFEGIARRLRLPGNFMNLEGKVLGGGELDWDSYRGKVVLVDFWATWCGPCIAELPNVKENYKKYHDKGFDVVGISLDRSRAPLDKFIEAQELPWAQMYDETIQANKGWNHPMAQFYGINAIPAAILVDKEGKVVTLKARGEELTKQLEKLLGKVE
ncbi:MAG: TlpA disulfide reductase family protein [Planctomycetaceae bacterium]